MRHTPVLLTALFAFLVFAVSPARAETAEHKISLKNHVFNPAEITIKADEKVKLIVTNEDKETAEFESHDLHREKVIPAGATASITVGPLKAGEYKFVDEFHEETAKGVIIVK